MSSEESRVRESGMVFRALGVVERVGNKLPHPFFLFVILSILLIFASWGMEAVGLSAERPDDGETVAVQSLVSVAGVQMMVTDAIENFITFPPLGIVLAVMLGVSVAERAGMLGTLLRATIVRAPARIATFVLALVGICSNVASDAAYVVLVPLGALVFLALGRNPIVGLVTAYTSIAAGYNTGLLISPTDALFAGLTTSAAQTVDPDYVVTPVANWYFSAAVTVVLALVITVVIEKVVAPRAGEWNPSSAPNQPGNAVADSQSLNVEPAEMRGLRNAGLATAAFALFWVLVLVPEGSPLRGENGSLVESPFLDGIALILGLAFLTVGVAYGMTVGTIRQGADIPRLMAEGLKDMTPIIVLFFAISQFLAYFSWSGVGEYLAIVGSGGIQQVGLQGPLLFFGMLLMVMALNLIITSGSAQWALMSAILVPMFIFVDVSPEITQAIYRIGDSTTNIITPMSPYFAMTLGFVQAYNRNAGVGTLAAMTLPLALAVSAVWFLCFLAWWGLGLPLGPGAPVR